MQLDPLKNLEVALAGGVATVTLNRPDRLNAYTVEMGAELFRTLAALDEADEVRAIVVTGKGRGFCAGMDLAGGGDTFAGENTWDETRRLEQRVLPWNASTPIIAAINGPAVGIGATLPLQWDIRIAAKSARIGYVFTRRGIVTEAHSSWILPRLIGLSKAMELLITGRIVSADEALALGLVSRVVDDGELLATAQAMARDIADNCAPISVAVTKRLLWRQLLDDDPAHAKKLEDEIFQWIGKQPDAAEGVKAFLEKRPPAWTMKKSRDLPPALR
jgi:enoyl-CoA hydratase/carnithine racemase